MPLKLALSRYPLNKSSQHTKHKVEQRDFYDGERARLKALHKIDEVLFLDDNERLCEGSFTSVFVEFENGLFTPSLKGILPSILRAEMIAKGAAKQKRINLSDLKEATAIYVGNSLRGLMGAKLISLERL
jgi:para-aminobenzoate synthetase/4-amino-4-deoxychorismate lyase